MHGFDALDLLGKLSFPRFSLESMLIHQMGQTQILVIICILFLIGHNKHVLLIVIHDFDALVSEEKRLFPSFLRVKVHLSIGTSIDSHSNLLLHDQTA